MLVSLLNKLLWLGAACAWIFTIIIAADLALVPSTTILPVQKSEQQYKEWKNKAVNRTDKTVFNIIPVRMLPEVNSLLNGISGTLLLLGCLFLLLNAFQLHMYSMMGATLFSGLFLTSYLILHSQQGATPFPLSGLSRTVYFSILISHSILAATLPFLVPIQFYYSWKQAWEQHRALGKWLLPVWLYVSPTGILVYLLLYQLPLKIS